MNLNTVLIVDAETTGVDRESDHVIEIGYVLWSVQHRTILEAYSGLLWAEKNPAQAVNGIPADALPQDAPDGPWRMLGKAASRADAIVAHQADFDRAFLERGMSEFDTGAAKIWICTREDVTWPRAGAGQSLTAIALAHGCAVVAAHRAVNDCLLLARLFESVPDIAARLEAGYAHAQLPKVRLVSLAPFEQKDEVKAHGFKWDPGRREWWRVMAAADAAGLPFKTAVREVGSHG